MLSSKLYFGVMAIGARYGASSSRLFGARLFVVVIGFAAAQQKAPDNENSVLAQISKLDWKFGPTQGDIGAVASIAVPQGSLFLGAAGTRRFLELQGNLSSDNDYTFGPRDLSWFSVFSFDPSGYVKDDEKIDPDELLAS